MKHFSAIIASLMFLTACIRPQNYHAGKSVFTIQFPESGAAGENYFYAETVREAYIEFDAQGHLFEPEQVNRAIAEIKRLQRGPHGEERKIFLTAFIHGWKNNASEASGNVWGFRRMIDHIAYLAHQKDKDMPIIGVYLGWPGDMTKIGKNLSFWNREQVAQTIGAGDLDETLKQLLQATKGANYQGQSIAVVVGHSFGGLVMEKAMIRLLTEYADNLDHKRSLAPPADMTLLLNEAGAASQARAFLAKLSDRHEALRARLAEHPLMISMTSDGDIATKVAFPGGEFISPSRPATQAINPPDAFGQKSTLSYNLLTAANMTSLRSHQIQPLDEGSSCSGILIPQVHQKDYCLSRIDGSLNKTPYWIMALPQVFVPDHGQIFRNEVLALINAVLANEGFMAPRPTNAMAKPELPHTLNETDPSPT